MSLVWFWCYLVTTKQIPTTFLSNRLLHPSTRQRARHRRRAGRSHLHLPPGGAAGGPVRGPLHRTFRCKAAHVWRGEKIRSIPANGEEKQKSREHHKKQKRFPLKGDVSAPPGISISPPRAPSFSCSKQRTKRSGLSSLGRNARPGLAAKLKVYQISHQGSP